MNLFSKQISTIFFSLFFFLLSGEAWAVAYYPNISDCQISTTAGTCSTTCGGSNGDTYSFTYGNSASDPHFGDTITIAASTSGTSQTVADCKLSCVSACSLYRNSSEYAVASTSVNTFSKSICNAFRIVTGSAGKTFAAFAIIATGIGFFSGKVSWGLMIGVAAGIATMFGAPSIVAAISGSVVDTKCTLATGMSGN